MPPHKKPTLPSAQGHDTVISDQQRSLSEACARILTCWAAEPASATLTPCRPHAPRQASPMHGLRHAAQLAPKHTGVRHRAWHAHASDSRKPVPLIAAAEAFNSSPFLLALFGAFSFFLPLTQPGRSDMPASKARGLLPVGCNTGIMFATLKRANRLGNTSRRTGCAAAAADRRPRPRRPSTAGEPSTHVREEGGTGACLCAEWGARRTWGPGLPTPAR